MKYTHYGIFICLGCFAFLSVYKKLDTTFIIVILLTLLSQKFICPNCGNVYTMAGYMTVFPLFQVLLNDCNNIKKFIIGASLAAAIGRIGCYYAGCCTGKEIKDNNCTHNNCTNDTCTYGITYKGNYIINKKLKKDKVCVTPTILYEIVLQFLFVIIMISFENSYKYFGIFNAILIILTNVWRFESRMQGFDFIAPASLILTSIIIPIKCSVKAGKQNYKTYLISFAVSIIVGLIFSNDINVNTILNFKKNR